MRATGIVRKIDLLGRFVIPIEIRRTLGVGDEDSLEVFVDGDRVILKKYTPGCTLCGGMHKVTQLVTGKRICDSCLSQILENRGVPVSQ